jgi:hypothetical protein
LHDKGGQISEKWASFHKTFCNISQKLGGIIPLGVLSDVFPENKMREHLPTAPDVLVIWSPIQVLSWLYIA